MAEEEVGNNHSQGSLHCGYEKIKIQTTEGV